MFKEKDGIFGYSSCTVSTYSSFKERQITKEHHISFDKVFIKPNLD